jgi:hypothetical protein
MPYTSVNGHMSSFLAADGTVALRLGTSDRERFVDELGAVLHEAHRMVLADYVSVPEAMVDDLDGIGPWSRPATPRLVAQAEAHQGE